MGNERKFRLEFKLGKEDKKESVDAETAASAVRKMFPKAGAIKLAPAEVVHYFFEAEIEGGKNVKGEVYLARRPNEDPQR